jgi:hypothetical protein
VISVLIPSRRRDLALAASIDSLHACAASPGRIGVEYLVAADPDDYSTIVTAEACGARTWTAPERYGYQRLHEYYNHLAAMASGAWLLMWNDDTRMLTPGWDQIIEAQTRDTVLWPHARGHGTLSNPFPAWPAWWTRATGRVSPVMHPDTHIQGIGRALGKARRISVEISHDRPDITGRPADQTYAEGRALLGPSGMVQGWDRDEAGRLALADADLIRAAR